MSHDSNPIQNFLLQACDIGERVSRRIGLEFVAIAVEAVSARIEERKRTEKCVEILEQFKKACSMSKEVLGMLVNELVSNMEAGLLSNSTSSLKMLPSFVETLPNGNEKGSYFALDLGGTNFRLLHVHLGSEEGRVVKQEIEENSIPETLKTASGQELFDFIAQKLANFVRRIDGTQNYQDMKQSKALSFTFSFPVDQKSINSGSLLEWTKGFTCHGVIGEDVVQLLKEALIRAGLEDMKVTALVNDTVGTLAAGRYWNEDTMIAIILGTGTNSCYVESWSATVLKPNDHLLSESGTTIINTEWSHFRSPHLPVTDMDIELLYESPNPGQQQYEKLISGMYLGEIVRRVLQKMAEESGIFGKSLPSKLGKPQALDTASMSVMHEDESDLLQNVAKVLENSFHIIGTSFAVRRIVQMVCDVVCKRAGLLAAVGIVAMVRKIGRDRPSTNEHKRRTVIAVDGGLYENYKMFRDYLLRGTNGLLGEEVGQNVSITLCKYGSGFGAAVLAASHSHLHQTSEETL